MSEELVEYEVKFKDIEGYIGIYRVTDDGRVYSKISERFLKTQINFHGYVNINLYKNNIRKKYLVHRLVAMEFLNNPENKPHVDHINGIKTDNRLCNLRFATISENRMNSKMKKNNKLQTKGIIKNRNNFKACIMKNGKNITKTFKKLEDAIIWRKIKEEELFGEFAHKD